MIYRFKCIRKGITLVELIVSLAIISFIMVGVFALFSFGNKTYASGTKQQDVQSSIRTLSNYITRQVRYATDISVINITSEPSAATMNPYENYIYLNSSDNTIKHVTKYYTKIFTIGKNPIIEFKGADSNKGLNFNIYAEKENQKYNIQTEVIILNLVLGTAKAVTGSSSGNAIKYVTATDYMAEKLRPIAQIGGVNTEKEIDVNYDRDIISASIVSSIGVTNPQISVSGRDVILKTDSTASNSTILFRVMFGGDDTYGSTYDYTINYNGPTWSIE